MQRAKTLATTAVNGAMGADSRAALADEITSIRSQLADIANTNVGGRALFAGLQNTAVTQVNGTWTFTGDSEAVKRQIGSASTVRVNAEAPRSSDSAGPGQDVFSVLDQLRPMSDPATPPRSRPIRTAYARYSNLTTGLGTVGRSRTPSPPSRASRRRRSAPCSSSSPTSRTPTWPRRSCS